MLSYLLHLFMSPWQVKFLSIPAKCHVVQRSLLSLFLRSCDPRAHSLLILALSKAVKHWVVNTPTSMFNSWNMSTLLSSPLLKTTVASSTASSTRLRPQKVVFRQHFHMRLWNDSFVFCVPPCKHFSRKKSSASVVNIWWLPWRMAVVHSFWGRHRLPILDRHQVLQLSCCLLQCSQMAHAAFFIAARSPTLFLIAVPWCPGITNIAVFFSPPLPQIPFTVFPLCAKGCVFQLSCFVCRMTAHAFLYLSAALKFGDVCVVVINWWLCFFDTRIRSAVTIP